MLLLVLVLLPQVVRTSTRACTREARKRAAEAEYRDARGLVWFEHIQKAGGHFLCGLARSSGGARDIATDTCCCGHAEWDRAVSLLPDAASARALLARLESGRMRDAVRAMATAAPAACGAEKGLARSPSWARCASHSSTLRIHVTLSSVTDHPQPTPRSLVVKRLRSMTSTWVVRH